VAGSMARGLRLLGREIPPQESHCRHHVDGVVGDARKSSIEGNLKDAPLRISHGVFCFGGCFPESVAKGFFKELVHR